MTWISLSLNLGGSYTFQLGKFVFIDGDTGSSLGLSVLGEKYSWDMNLCARCAACSGQVMHTQGVICTPPVVNLLGNQQNAHLEWFPQ